MKTVYHAYQFDTHDPAQAAAWTDLRQKLKKTHPRIMHSHGGAEHYQPKMDGLTIELDTKHFFSNQWNTAPIEGISTSGLRVFDWAQDALYGHRAHIVQGHYLDQTLEMTTLRYNTRACRYCGHREPAETSPIFCNACLGSEYLTADDLKLTRMTRVCDSDSPFAPLTAEEMAERLPLFIHAQTFGNTEREKQRIADNIKDITESARLTIERAEMHRDGFLWLISHGMKTKNVIYYTHTGRFCFGWQKKYSPELLEILKVQLEGFNFPYDIETTTGKQSNK